MAKIKILLTGGSGFIGRNIYNSLKSNYQITRPSSKKLDLTDREQVLKRLEIYKQYEVCVKKSDL